MATRWVTSASTRPGPVVNSITAACEAGHRPDALALLTNPTVADQVAPITERASRVVEAYDGTLDVAVTSLDEETDFAGIVAHYREAIEAARAEDDTVAVDVTPGRKFVSAIAFQAGLTLEADHVFYLHVESNRFFDRSYPEIPRSGVELLDFTEELA